ncbi:hypothetical protein D3C72_2206270 [compost metagenome]
MAPLVAKRGAVVIVEVPAATGAVPDNAHCRLPVRREFANQAIRLGGLPCLGVNVPVHRQREVEIVAGRVVPFGVSGLAGQFQPDVGQGGHAWSPTQVARPL